jgi:hypothetical protein
LHLIAGLVGYAAAGEFEAFVRIYDAVRGLIDEVLASPGTAKVPTDAAGLYAVSSAIARVTDRKTFPNILTYAVLWAVYGKSRELRQRTANVPFGECIEIEE